MRELIDLGWLFLGVKTLKAFTKDAKARDRIEKNLMKLARIAAKNPHSVMKALPYIGAAYYGYRTPLPGGIPGLVAALISLELAKGYFPINITGAAYLAVIGGWNVMDAIPPELGLGPVAGQALLRYLEAGHV